eukprot:CAMPEP_0113959756 /NCGR_PEP_ID=MMETSP0011_2-20120614/4327_1 /TAXON_ID=101924 /ORGANISM="Rhodosorus marinus" /LENGTH=1093 /DNA_ID=CAMNT_0000971115 /DNA_START=88 /DNA_END=3369 /DNA_ORIENTATION=+ /assembly_acc=CAM_ASM_000156
MKLLYVVGALLVLVLNTAHGQVIDRDNILHELVIEGEGFRSPLDFDWIPGNVDRIIICEKRGLIHLAVNGVLQSTPFLDIQNKVMSDSGRGLMGCLIDVDFKKQPYLYVSYTDDRISDNPNDPQTGIVSRFKVNAQVTQASGEVILMGKSTTGKKGCGGNESIGKKDIICNDANMHNHGGLTMNPDGELFVGLGDGADPPVFDDLPIRAVDLDWTVGKVLCIQRDGKACKGNPFQKGNDFKSNRAKVWNSGLRNPFRVNWDPVLKVPLIAHVGFASFESIFAGTKGRNFGWPCLEGPKTNLKANNYKECKDIARGKTKAGGGSLWDYDHDFGTSVTGVARLSSNKWPNSLKNMIAVCDYTKSWIKLIKTNKNGIQGKPEDLMSDVLGPVQLKQGPDGHLYYISIIAQKIFRIRYQLDKSRPTVSRMSPPQKASNVETTVRVGITFSKKIKTNSINAKNIKLQLSNNKKLVNAKLVWEAGTNTVYMEPRSTLKKDTSYVVVVSGIVDSQGRKMKGSFTSPFKTGGGFSLYISDLKFQKATNGIKAPVLRDKQQFQSAQNVVPPLSLRGETFRKGLGTVAESVVTVKLPAGCKRFQSYVGVDDFRRNFESGEMIFTVEGKGKKGTERLYRNNKVVTKTDPALYIDVDVGGFQTVSFISSKTKKGGTASAVGTWGDAQFRCGSYDKAEPKVVKITPVSNVGVNQEIIVLFSEPMEIQSTIESTTLHLPVESGGYGYDIGVQIEFNNKQTFMTIKPSAPLSFNTEYVLSIGKGATDLSGNSLKSRTERRIKTRKEGTAGQKIGLTELNAKNVRPQRNFSKGAKDTLELKPDVSVDYLVPGNCGSFSFDMSAKQGGKNMRMTVAADGKVLCGSGPVNAGQTKRVKCDVLGQNDVTLTLDGNGGLAVLSNAEFNCAQGSRLPRCEFGKLPNKFVVGQKICYSAKCYDFKGNQIPKKKMLFLTQLVHCQKDCHFHEEQTVENATGGCYKAPDHGDYYYLEFQVFADDGKNTGMTARQVRPETAAVTVTTMPPGAVVGVDSLSGPSPLRSIVLVKARFTINASKNAGNRRFRFWDDNKKQPADRELLFNKPGPRKYNAVYK